MRLVYTATKKPVQIGDKIQLTGQVFHVSHFAQPHKPDSEGKVSLRLWGHASGPEYYVGVIGAEWIEREDRAHDGLRVVFNDGTYGVTIGRQSVLIAKQDGAAIHVPRGHAYFDRVCEADDRRTVEDLHSELTAAIA